MANNTLVQYLQFQGQEGQTGCIVVNSHGNAGRIYLHRGSVIHAEAKQDKGLLAFFLMLTWSNANLDWVPDQLVSTISFEEPIDTLLFQFAQLEDTGQADEASLIALFQGSYPASEEIKLTELKHYLITLEVLNAEYHGMVFTLNKETSLVGRAEDCDIVIPDPTITSHHCTITQENNCVHVTDLGSTNGTFINGKLVTNAILQVGDDLFLGQIGMRMSMKMQRKLAISNDFYSGGTPGAVPISRPNFANSSPTQGETSSAKPSQHEAITWKSLEEENQASAKTRTGLLSRFFGNK